MKNNIDIERKKVLIVVCGLIAAWLLYWMFQELVVEPAELRKEERIEQEEKRAEKKAGKEWDKRKKIIEEYMKETSKALRTAIRKEGIKDIEVKYNVDWFGKWNDNKDRTHYENGKKYKESDKLDYRYDEQKLIKCPLCDANGDYPYYYTVYFTSMDLDKIADRYSSYKDFMKCMIRIKKIVDEYTSEEIILPYTDSRSIIMREDHTLKDSDSEFSIFTDEQSWSIEKSDKGDWELWYGVAKRYPDDDDDDDDSSDYDDYEDDDDYYDDDESGSRGSGGRLFNNSDDSDSSDDDDYQPTPSKKPEQKTKKYDPYDVYDYDDPDDFADDWAEEFGYGDYDYGYDDAYEYWEEEHGR